MRSHETLEKKIYNWIETIAPKAGIDTIVYVAQNGIEPKEDFIALELSVFSVDSRPEIRYQSAAGIDPDSIEEKMIYRAVLQLDIRLIAQTGALSKLETLKAFIYSSRSIEHLMVNDLGISTVGDTQDASWLQSESFRKRADLTIYLHYTSEYKDILETIGTVNIIGEDSDTGRVIVDAHVNENAQP